MNPKHNKTKQKKEPRRIQDEKKKNRKGKFSLNLRAQ